MSAWASGHEYDRAAKVEGRAVERDEEPEPDRDRRGAERKGQDGVGAPGRAGRGGPRPRPPAITPTATATAAATTAYRSDVRTASKGGTNSVEPRADSDRARYQARP